MTRVGIIGAGITGLSLAHFLDDQDCTPLVFEATGEPGGVIRSDQRKGRVLEYGPQRARLTPILDSLVEDLGLTNELRLADSSLPLYVYADGKLRQVPRSIREFMTTDALSLRGKLRVLAEPITAPGRETETASEFFTRKFGAEAASNLLCPLFGGIYGSDPARMPAKYALQSLRRIERDQGSLLRAAIKRLRDGDRPPAFSFTDGLQRLPEALAVQHAGAIRFDSPVETVRDTPGGFELQLATETVDVDAVVVTAPASEAGEILQPVAAGADRLRSLGYNPLAIVHLESDYRDHGYGYQIRQGEGFKTLGVTWNASLFDRDGIYTSFLGGMHAPHLLDRPDSELGQLARDEFEAITGGAASVIDVWRSKDAFPAYDTSWEGLEQVTLPPGVHLATNYTGRLGIPARVREARTLAHSLA